MNGELAERLALPDRSPTRRRLRDELDVAQRDHVERVDRVARAEDRLARLVGGAAESWRNSFMMCDGSCIRNGRSISASAVETIALRNCDASSAFFAFRPASMACSFWRASPSRNGRSRSIVAPWLDGLGRDHPLVRVDAQEDRDAFFGASCLRRLRKPWFSIPAMSKSAMM
jgi:hypothetical protein